MDEKVLNLLIERVEKSAQMVIVHKNEAWIKCLEDDKKRLKDYCLKQQKTISSEESNPIPGEFRFKFGGDIFKAKKLTDIKYRITWISSNGEIEQTHYDKDVVKINLDDGRWVIID